MLLLLGMPAMRPCGALVGFPPMRGSGKCTDEDGGAWIMDYATCQQARTALGLSDTSVGSLSTSSYYARGCVSTSAGSDVRFNTNTGSSADCGYNGYSCLCAPSTAPVCDPADGSDPHSSSPTCVCGTGKLCSSNTGMVCVGSTTTCSQTPTPCADTSAPGLTGWWCDPPDWKDWKGDIDSRGGFVHTSCNAAAMAHASDPIRGGHTALPSSR